jgi:sulfur carrier protein
VSRLEIVLNGKVEKLEKKMELSALLLAKGLNPDTVIVEYNHNIVKKQEWEKIVLQDNDSLEVLNFVGGG